jgi:hypothetical protein
MSTRFGRDKSVEQTIGVFSGNANSVIGDTQDQLARVVLVGSNQSSRERSVTGSMASILFISRLMIT